MLYLVEQKHLESESYRLHLEDKERDAEANWKLAQENLTLFPQRSLYSDEVSKQFSTASGHFGAPTAGWWAINSMGLLEKTAIVVHWMGCRETFEKVYGHFRASTERYRFGHDYLEMNGIGSFYYSTEGPLAAAKVAKFLRFIEVKKLDLSNLTRFESQGAILRISPSGFWLESTMRLSLFSVLCRSGHHFNENLDDPNLDPCFRNGLKRRSENLAPIHRFLSGYNRYVGSHDPTNNSRNWIDTFNDAGDGAGLLAK